MKAWKNLRRDTTSGLSNRLTTATRVYQIRWVKNLLQYTSDKNRTFAYAIPQRYSNFFVTEKIANVILTSNLKSIAETDFYDLRVWIPQKSPESLQKFEKIQYIPKENSSKYGVKTKNMDLNVFFKFFIGNLEHFEQERHGSSNQDTV
uniref:Uncharacterized protein n=1 Tax=Romanomermis culicivorax TaxID=13658 RepID=A0A915K3R5_ROMCU